MSIKQKKTVEYEGKCVEIEDTRLKMPNSHGLVSLTVTRPRKFIQSSSKQSFKSSNQGYNTGDIRQKPHGCKSISCVNPEKFNNRKTRANETGFDKELATRHSKQLLNAVGIFNSNKELFISLLENPNSLLVNQIEKFQDSRAKRKKTKHFHEGKLAEFHAKEERGASSAKPRDRSLSVQEDDPRLMRKLAVLKPSPLTRQDSIQKLSLCSFLHYHSIFVRKRPRSLPPFVSIGNLKRKIMQVLKLGGKVPKKSPHFFYHAEDYGQEINIEEALGRTSSGRSYSDNGSRPDEKNRDKKTDNKGDSINQIYESSKINGDVMRPVSDSDSDSLIKVSAEMELHDLGNEDPVCDAAPVEDTKKKTNDPFQTRCTKLNIAQDLCRETNFDGDEFVRNDSENITSVKMNRLLFSVSNSSNINIKTEGENWSSQERFSSDASTREAFEFDESSEHALEVDMEIHSSSKILAREFRGNLTTTDRYGTISGCIKGLQLASRFQCEELVAKCHLFDRMNVQTLLEQLKLLRNQLCGDCRLLADYITEILEDLLQCHKEHSIEFLNVEKVMFHEVMKWASCQFMQPPLPTTWENLAKESITRSRAWRGSPEYAESIVVETAKCVLEELIMETTSNIVSFPVNQSHIYSDKFRIST